MDSRYQEISEWNQQNAADHSVLNLRKMTNIGTFRAYLQGILRNHPRLRKDMTMMVRQLAPDANGLPIEIYCFTSTVVWAEYESIGLIFSTIFAVVTNSGCVFTSHRPATIFVRWRRHITVILSGTGAGNDAPVHHHPFGGGIRVVDFLQQQGHRRAANVARRLFHGGQLRRDHLRQLRAIKPHDRNIVRNPQSGLRNRAQGACRQRIGDGKYRIRPLFGGQQRFHCRFTGGSAEVAGIGHLLPGELTHMEHVL